MDNLQGNWLTIFTASGHSGAPVTVSLTVPADLALVRVTLTTPRPEWRRAGWLKQYAVIDGERSLLTTSAIELNGQLVTIYPTADSELVFYPVAWLDNWGITLKIRDLS